MKTKPAFYPFSCLSSPSQLRLVYACIILLLPALLATAWAQPPEPAAAADAKPVTKVVIHAVGDVHEVELNRVANHVARESRLDVIVGAPTAPSGKTLVEQAKAFTATKAADAPEPFLNILLTRVQPEDPQHAFLDATNQVMVINLVALTDKDKEITLQRIERHALRAVSFAVGMKSCLYPRCALRTYREMKHLDESSRNLCPPCQGLYAMRVAEKKLTLKPIQTVNPAALLPAPPSLPAPGQK